MEKVYYYNRNGILKLTFGEDPYYMVLGSGEFKDQTWGYDDQFGHLGSFRRDKTTYPFSVAITSNNLADYDILCDIFTDDILANEPGYLLINGWRLDCYVIKSEHSFYGKRDHVIAFEAVSPNSTWLRMVTRSYNGDPGGGSTGEDLGRDYIYWVVPTEEYEDEGSIVEIDNPDSNLEVTALSVSLEPIQSGSGTPSPDNVRPISGRTEVVTQRAGKNLLRLSDFNESMAGVTYTYTASSGTIAKSGTSSGTAGINVGTVSLKEGTYTISANFNNESGSRTSIYLRSVETNTNVTSISSLNPTATLSLSGDYYIRLATLAGATGGTIKDIQLELGTTATAYEPYEGNTYTTALGRTVYGGTLDVVSGELTVDKAMVTLDGTQNISIVNWRPTSSGVGWVYPYSLTNNKVERADANMPKLVSDSLPTITYGTAYQGTSVGVTTLATTGTTSYGLVVRTADASLTTASAINAYLSAHPITVCYELATPQTYQLTPTQINLITGRNYVWSSVSDIDIKYQTQSVAVPARGYNYGYSTPESHYASIDLAGSGNGFEAIIYGPQVNPVIYLDNQPVKVNITLEATQRLRIVSNGSVKTIEILEPNGESTDAFVYRDKENTPFLTLGQHTDLTFGQIRFDFTTIERRSEPSWI